MKGKYDEEKLKHIYVPCTVKGKGGKDYFRKIPLLSCMKRCQSDLVIHEDCHKKKRGKKIPCEFWKDYLPNENTKKKIHYKIHYRITY